MNKKEMFDTQRERFGRSFERATRWYSLLHSKEVKKFDEDDFRLCYYQYNLMKALGNMTEKVMFEDGTSKEVFVPREYVDIDDTFEVMKVIFGISSDAETCEDKIDFVKSCLDKFNLSAQTERLHKASIRILKMSFEDLKNDGNGYYFDSRLAGKSGNLRWILTSEDGISRLLQLLGKEQVVINLNTTSLENGSKEDEKRYQDMKEDLFLNGVVDIATGKRYLCSTPSASSTRHVDFPFIKADKPEEVYDVWCRITGFDTLEELVGGIGKRKDDGIYVIFAKLKARVAQNGANSLDAGRTASEEIKERLRNAKVVFVPDCKGAISIPYKEISSTGILTMKHPDGTQTDERV